MGAIFAGIVLFELFALCIHEDDLHRVIHPWEGRILADAESKSKGTSSDALNLSRKHLAALSFCESSPGLART